MPHEDDLVNEGKLDNRGLLILLNERYRNLDIGIRELNIQQSAYQKEFMDLKIEVNTLKTTGRIYTSIVAFLAGIGASIITAFILK